jgi:hypothetical protein
MVSCLIQNATAAMGAECLLAAMDASQTLYRDLNLSLARASDLLAREDESMADLLSIWSIEDTPPSAQVIAIPTVPLIGAAQPARTHRSRGSCQGSSSRLDRRRD